MNFMSASFAPVREQTRAQGDNIYVYVAQLASYTPGSISTGFLEKFR
jgi:hypothetical protein